MESFTLFFKKGNIKIKQIIKLSLQHVIIIITVTIIMIIITIRITTISTVTIIIKIC